MGQKPQPGRAATGRRPARLPCYPSDKQSRQKQPRRRGLRQIALPISGHSAQRIKASAKDVVGTNPVTGWTERQSVVDRDLVIHRQQEDAGRQATRRLVPTQVELDRIAGAAEDAACRAAKDRRERPPPEKVKASPA